MAVAVPVADAVGVVSSVAAAEHSTTVERLAPDAWRRLAACIAAAALLQLDGTLATVALPTVAAGLHVSLASTAIVLSGYFAAYAAALLPGGMLVDVCGARRAACAGLALFALGAIAAALAPSFAALIAARVLQGIGAGLLSPAALAGAVSGFPPAMRGSALGIWGASAGVANLIGPPLGGLLTVLWGWRAVWWALIVLTGAAAWAIREQVPATVRDAHHIKGAVVWHSRTVIASAVAAGVTFAVMIGCFYLAEEYLQHAAGYSPLAASTVLVLVAVLVAGAAPAAGSLCDRRGERPVAVSGFALCALGLGTIGLPWLSPRAPIVLAPLVVLGVGLGLLFVPISRAALNAMPSALHGRTSAALSIGRLVGAAAGAGLVGIALRAGADAHTVHRAVLVACGLCLGIGIPVAIALGPSRPVVAESGGLSGRRPGGDHEPAG